MATSKATSSNNGLSSLISMSVRIPISSILLTPVPLSSQVRHPTNSAMPAIAVPSKIRSACDIRALFVKHGILPCKRRRSHEEDDDEPPTPPPKDTTMKVRRRQIESWQQTYLAFEISPLARTPSDNSSASSESELFDSLEGTAGHRGSDALFVTREYIASQSNLARVQDAALSPRPERVPLPHSPTRSALLTFPAAASSHIRMTTYPSPSRIPMASYRIPTTRERLPERRVASNPDELERKRREAMRRKEREEAQARREEAERQARLKREKEEILRRAQDEENARKAALEEELRRVAEERKKRERIEREADEARRFVAEEKRRIERERRMQEAAKAQAWRLEQAKREQEAEGRREAMRRRVYQERQALAERVKTHARTASGSSVLLSGWITVQSDTSAAWKRRYYQLNEKALVLFKNPDETTQILETVKLANISHIREWQEGYEELEGVPHSFAVEFKDGRPAWSMYADTAQDKEYLVALLSNAVAPGLPGSLGPPGSPNSPLSNIPGSGARWWW
ncbi:hypothetical protein WOLCODRAFT_165109 [Wolfiporia cocos MD-104 SS10]|uniref:PH domain-containing protein n=1 Tax=Wolfiporia cocos (strain MD-104) TaxID=742152 RepID=A0A2H3JQH1_WOLCO|nr:hypothetical protein WOLCODRAFT_165109 [Wolfiporia cocos MD-104 SS10]